MFTGIIHQFGAIQTIEKRKSGLRLGIRITHMPKKITLGSSVAVSGVCLTVIKKQGKNLLFDVMSETIKKTALNRWRVGTKVHIEPSLTIGDEVGGHFVFGHVDTIATVKKVVSDAANTIIVCTLPKEVRRSIVPQGSVAIDGVSLTVAHVGKSDFSVSLVEYTLRHTTLRDLKPGDVVHIECDMLAKYVAKMIA